MKNFWISLLALVAVTNLWVQAQLLCPLCENSHEQFLKGGVMSRDDAACPTCDSYERHRHLWLFLNEKKQDLFKQDLCTEKLTLLHWAPEQCLSSRLKKVSHLNYIKADIDRPDDKEILKLDITHIDLPDNSVDIVVCCHVLEHIPDDHKAMTEVFRVLKPGGSAIFMVPIYINLTQTFEDFSITNPDLRMKYFDQYDHVRKYAWDITGRFTKAGFLVEVYPLTSLADTVRKKYGMAGYDYNEDANAGRGADIFLCIKP